MSSQWDRRLGLAPQNASPPDYHLTTPVAGFVFEVRIRALGRVRSGGRGRFGSEP